MNNVRKIAGYVLVGIIIVFTVIAILGIWDVINFEELFRKVLSSLLIVFVSSSVVLFITTVLIKDDSANKSIE